jgi:hypothetical protein
MAAYTMNDDPFSFNVSKVEKEPQIRSESSFIGFYICSFDTSHGLQVLYTYPSKLKDNREEVNTLKTHYIWNFEYIPVRIDLKFSEFVYSGFQLHNEDSPNVIATVEKPLFGVILKLWKDGQPIPSEILKDFIKDLQELHWDDINLLFKYQSLSLIPSQRRKYKMLFPEVQRADKDFRTTWKTLMSKISFSKVELRLQNSKIEQNSLMSDKKGTTEGFFKRKITMRVVSIKDSDQIFVILFNNGKELQDVTITVSKSTDFFSEPLWQQSVDQWPTKEDLILEFQRSNIITNYLIKISSKNRTIAMKSLLIES